MTGRLPGVGEQWVNSVDGRDGLGGQSASVPRDEYYHDPSAPEPNSLAPSAFAVVRDDADRILLVRRADNGVWELPGGRVDLGESATTAAEREVAEKSGITVKITRLAGVYTDPGHIIVHADTGEARQEFVVCFHALPLYGDPHPDDHETCDAAWVPTDRLHQLDIHPTMQRRITDALSAPLEPHIG
jgi:ADP-ribose pyrophosphatase YjhB (NUDIX family)